MSVLRYNLDCFDACPGLLNTCCDHPLWLCCLLQVAPPVSDLASVAMAATKNSGLQRRLNKTNTRAA